MGQSFAKTMCAVRSQGPNTVNTSMNSIANIVSESIKASELQCLLGFISFILVVNNQSVNNNTVLQLGIYDIDLNGATVASDCCALSLRPSSDTLTSSLYHRQRASGGSSTTSSLDVTWEIPAVLPLLFHMLVLRVPTRNPGICELHLSQ